MTKSNAERYAEFEQRLADMKAADAAWVQFLDVLTGKLPAGSRLWVSDPDDDGLVEVCEDDGTLADGIRRGLRERGAP